MNLDNFAFMDNLMHVSQRHTVGLLAHTMQVLYIKLMRPRSHPWLRDFERELTVNKILTVFVYFYQQN
jgi:hypothetical protein